MPYYMGDYYPGYRRVGDPGLFGTLGRVIGKAGGVIGKIAAGVAGGGIVGGVATALPVLFGQGGRQSPAPLPAPITPGGGINLPGPYRVNPTGILPGGKPFITREGGGVPSGYHLDKKTGSYAVRNRSMNPANPRALRRAIRREKRFVALARSVLRGTGLSIKRASSFAARKGRRR